MTSRSTNTTARDFRVVRLFHPTIHAPDLAEAERWFARGLGRDSTPLSTLFRDAPAAPGYPTDYSIFTVVRDVFFDTVDPKRFVFNGVQRYPDVEAPYLKALGWYVDGMPALYRELRRRGIRVTNLANEVVDGEEPPAAPGGNLMFFTVPEDAGLRYQLYREGPFPLDRRTMPGWVLPAVEGDDPLQIERCSHHTVLTRQPERALKLVVDVLGGRVVHEGPSRVLAATSTFVQLADAVFEYAVPDVGSSLEATLAKQAPLDAYYGVTWRVGDLARVERHLAECGAHIQARAADTIVTDPNTSFGVAWGFTTGALPGVTSA